MDWRCLAAHSRIPKSGLHMTKEHPAGTMIIPLCLCKARSRPKFFRLGLSPSVKGYYYYFFTRKSIRMRGRHAVCGFHHPAHMQTIRYRNGTAAGAYARTERMGGGSFLTCIRVSCLVFAYGEASDNLSDTYCYVHGLPPTATRSAERFGKDRGFVSFGVVFRSDDRGRSGRGPLSSRSSGNHPMID